MYCVKLFMLYLLNLGLHFSKALVDDINYHTIVCEGRFESIAIDDLVDTRFVARVDNISIALLWGVNKANVGAFDQWLDKRGDKQCYAF